MCTFRATAEKYIRTVKELLKEHLHKMQLGSMELPTRRYTPVTAESCSKKPLTATP